MKKTTFATLVGLAISTQAFAATKIQADDVIVTASRVPQSKVNVIADVSVITQEEIERAGQSTFIELLQKQPGVEISSNGGAGTISSIFMRGTNSNQTVVLIDGVRVNGISNGATYFGNIPLAQIERIEILRGPASSLYGQDAIGGVIQVFTKKISGEPKFNAAVGYGSYNTKTTEAGFGGSYNGLNYSLSMSSKDSDGFSSLKSNNSILSDKDGYRNVSANGSVSYDINEKNQVGIQFFNSQGSVHYDNIYATSYFDNRTELEQSTVSAFSKNQITDMWRSTLKLSIGVDKNDDYSSATKTTKIKSTQNQYSWQNDLNLPVGTLTAIIDRLEQEIDSNVSFLSTKRNSNGLYLGYLANVDNHSFQANIRRDDSSQYGTHITKGLGYGYKITEHWRTSASYGTAFKAPTFNDIYYPPACYFGFCYATSNLNLKPEKSENFEAALKYEDVNQAVSITAYRNKIKDFIALDSDWVPQNYNATIKGITLAGSQNWDDLLLNINLDFQSPRNSDNHNMLNRRANRHGVVNLTKSWGAWQIGTELIASSARYNDADNTEKMAGYAILNFVSSYKISNDWSLQGRVNNFFDKDYALALSSDGTITLPYNNPGANVFFSLRYAPSY